MPEIPSYLAGYEDEYAADPREAARQWFREAKYGLFLHYELYSLLGRHERDSPGRPATARPGTPTRRRLPGHPGHVSCPL